MGDDFVGGEVSGEPEETRGAKFASEGAADLRGNAEGEAIGFVAIESYRGGDEDALDEAAVVELEEEFAGGVVGALGLSDGGDAELIAVLEGFAEIGGEVGHLVDAGNAFFPEPVQDLGAAVGRLTEFLEGFGELIGGERTEIGFVGHGGTLFGEGPKIKNRVEILR